MKRTIAAMATVLMVASLGVGYVVGRAGGGDTGDSISSRLSSLISPASSAQRSTPAAGTPVGPATPDPDGGSGTPAVTLVLSTPAVTAGTPDGDGATPATPVVSSSSPALGTPTASTPVAHSLVPELAESATPADGDAAAGAPASRSATPRPLAASPIARATTSPSPSARPATIGGDGVPIDFDTPAPGA